MKRRKGARAKSIAELAAAIFVPRRLDAGPLNEREIEYLERELADLGGALARGAASTSQQQKAAQLIRALTSRRRGRPTALKTPLDNSMLAMTVDWIAAARAAKGDERPFESSIEEVRELERA